MKFKKIDSTQTKNQQGEKNYPIISADFYFEAKKLQAHCL